MTALGLGVRSIPSDIPKIALALLTGLNAATVGLIALAAFKLSQSTITDLVSRSILFCSAAFGICYQAPWVRISPPFPLLPSSSASDFFPIPIQMYPVLMAAGGLITLVWDSRHRVIDPLVSTWKNRQSRRTNTNNGEPSQTNGDHNLGAIELNNTQDDKEEPAEAAQVSSSSAAVTQHNAESGIRQRPVSHTQSSDAPATQAQPDAAEPTAIATMGPRMALTMAAAFVAVVVVFVVIRARVHTAGRAFDVSRRRSYRSTKSVSELMDVPRSFLSTCSSRVSLSLAVVLSLFLFSGATLSRMVSVS
jgi:hypothetical protein